MSTGIYKITNLINNKCYIGQSINIENRFSYHKQRAFNKNGKDYTMCIYQAFRKYGLENFIFEILEECNEEFLDAREIYWISYFDSYKSGYNSSLYGYHRNAIKGENHPNHKLTESDIIDIRTRYNLHERKKMYFYYIRIESISLDFIKYGMEKLGKI